MVCLTAQSLARAGRPPDGHGPNSQAAARTCRAAPVDPNSGHPDVTMRKARQRVGPAHVIGNGGGDAAPIRIRRLGRTTLKGPRPVSRSAPQLSQALEAPGPIKVVGTLKAEFLDSGPRPAPELAEGTLPTAQEGP
jgi:hypothetical protein